MTPLICVDCHAPMSAEPSELVCGRCGRRFERRCGVPWLVPAGGLDADEADVEELYTTVSHTYDDVFRTHVAEHYLRKRTNVVTQLASRYATVLDVGCSSGRLGEWIAARGYRVFGVDLSPGMLEVASRRGLAGVWGALTTALPFPNNTFDMALTVATLHHLKTPKRVAETIREMGRVVRPGGFLVIWDHNPRNPYWPILMKRYPQDRGDERLVPLEEISAAVAAAGLTTHRAFRCGFVPDFVPRVLFPIACWVEALVEATPGLRSVAAHNVVIAKKPLETSLEELSTSGSASLAEFGARLNP